MQQILSRLSRITLAESDLDILSALRPIQELPADLMTSNHTYIFYKALAEWFQPQLILDLNADYGFTALALASGAAALRPLSDNPPVPLAAIHIGLSASRYQSLSAFDLDLEKCRSQFKTVFGLLTAADLTLLKSDQLQTTLDPVSQNPSFKSLIHLDAEPDYDSTLTLLSYAHRLTATLPAEQFAVLVNNATSLVVESAIDTFRNASKRSAPDADSQPAPAWDWEVLPTYRGLGVLTRTAYSD